MRICICDDELQQCDNLKAMIESHGGHQISVFHSAEELLFECEGHMPFDCVFMDIQMKQMSGMECARKIREFDKKVSIVFLTMMKDYVFEGYEVNAVRYLLKPIEVDKCHEVLELVESMMKKEHAYLYVNKTKIDCEDILYIESFGHYCSIHGKEIVEVKTSLADIMKNLPNIFLQTHRSYIVNLEKVESIVKEGCLLSDNTVIPISRNAQKKVNEAFMEFIKGGLL